MVKANSFNYYEHKRRCALKDYMTRTSTLTFLFIVAVALVGCFITFTPVAGGILLDSLRSATESQQLLVSMSDVQKTAHFRITLWLDMLFPLAYGGFFLGLTLKNFKHVGIWLAIPAFLVIPTDICENLIQLLALTGTEDLLQIKAILTPIKFMLVNISATIAALSLSIGMWRRFV